MELNLTRPGEELREKFFALGTPEAVAALLEIKYSDLIYYLYRVPLHQQYKIFEIPKKSGGVRKISAPSSALKIIQSKLNTILYTVYQAPPSVHGFTLNIKRSIVSNAKTHIETRKPKYILNIDLKDFFPSINFGRVRGMFMARPYNLPDKVATVLAQICCYDNTLPQGAPTSPIISNMICAKMDTQLQKLAKKYKCVYTRYADDITFSTSMRNFPRTLATYHTYPGGQQLDAGSELKEIIEGNGFTVNNDKVRLQTTNQRQEITGLTINEFPNVTRRYVKQIRAMLFNWHKSQQGMSQPKLDKKYYKKHKNPKKKAPTFESVLRGKIEFLGSVRGKEDPIYLRFYYQFLRLSDPKFKDRIDKAPKIFMSHSSKDETFARLLESSLSKLGATTWLDVNDIPAGIKWSSAIQLGLEICQAMVVVITPEAMASENVADEWQYYLDKGKTVIPILLRPAEIHFQLNRVQYVDFQQNYEAALHLLCEELKEKGISFDV